MGKTEPFLIPGSPADSLNREKQQQRFIWLIGLIFLGVSSLYLIQNIVTGSYRETTVNLAVFVLSLVILQLVRRTLPLAWPIGIITVVYLAHIVYGLVFSKPEFPRLLWILGFPLVSVYLLAPRHALILNGLILAELLLTSFLPEKHPWAEYLGWARFPTGFQIRFIGLYGFLYAFLAIFERYRAGLVRQIEGLAYKDFLTGLPNRYAIQREWERRNFRQQARRGGFRSRRIAFLFFNLDDFRQVNYLMGHHFGDMVLREFAGHMSRPPFRNYGFYRLGGDDFCFMYPLRKGASLEIFIRRVAALLRRLARDHQMAMDLTASFGVSFFPRDGMAVEELINKAEIAQKTVKLSGKNNYAVYRRELNEQLARRTIIEQTFAPSMNRDEFYLLYHPQISLREKRVIGAEALLRWDHPDLGPLSPGEFIPLAEETGSILPLGQWALERAFAQISRMSGSLPERIQFSLNISPRQLLYREFLEVLMKTLAKHHLSPERIKLEITEEVIVDGVRESGYLLEKIRDLGFGLALDDFGTGYSNFSYLNKYPFDWLKLDRSLITDLKKPRQAPVLACIVGMSRELGMEPVAEGVETAHELEQLRAMGADIIQGFYFSRPLPEEDFVTFVREFQFPENSVGGP